MCSKRVNNRSVKVQVYTIKLDSDTNWQILSMKRIAIYGKGNCLL